MIIVLATLNAASIELEWKVPSDKYIKSYRVEYCSDTGVSVTIDVGKTTNYTINTLIEGKKYWFQVTPQLTNGLDGRKSNMIYYEVPVEKLQQYEIQPELKIKKKK